MIKRSLACLLFFSMSCAHAAVGTVSQLIERVQFNGELDQAYFWSSTGWGAPGCAGAQYIYVKADVPGRKQLLSMALAAKLAGAQVSFMGTCNTDVNYFDATYIIVR